MTLFVSDKNVEVMHIPRLVAEIRQVTGALIKTEEWSDPATRNPVIQQPTIQPQRRNSSPRRAEPQNRDISYRNLKQRFDHQFKSLLRITNGQEQIDAATVVQAETMYKNIAALIQTLDKSVEEDMDTVVITIHIKLMRNLKQR